MLAFSDGLFAIAMTLLVVGITVPVLREGDSVGELGDALGDLTGSFVSFLISFLVIGRYWVAHHEFFARLKAMDAGLIWINTHLPHVRRVRARSRRRCSATTSRTRSRSRSTPSPSRRSAGWRWSCSATPTATTS